MKCPAVRVLQLFHARSSISSEARRRAPSAASLGQSGDTMMIESFAEAIAMGSA